MMSDQSEGKSSNLLLEPEGRGLTDFVLPGILGLAGAALLYSSLKKKSPESKVPPLTEVGDQEIKFSKNFKDYLVGKNWEAAVLEPFLAEKAEDGSLLTLEEAQGSGFISAAGGEGVALLESRKKILPIFRSSHSATADSGQILLSQLPSGKVGVQKFNEWLDARIKNFQEEY